MRVLLILPVVFAATATVFLAACQGQGEGALCNQQAGNNGNDDCQSGLTCQSRPATVMNPFGLCCPPNGPSSSSACSTNTTSIDANPEPPPPATDDGAGSATPDGASSDAPSGDASDATVE